MKRVRGLYFYRQSAEKYFKCLEMPLRCCPHVFFAVISSETSFWAESDADDDILGCVTQILFL